jgi:hypothetical protein
MKTDDDFTIGQFSSDTVFLLGLTAVLGALVGGLYLVIRNWLPARRRSVWAGVLGGVVGGAGIVRGDGVDFTVLQPRWLAVAMFMLIPGLAGVAISALVERRLARAGEPSRFSWLAAAAVVPLVLMGTFGILVLVLVAGWIAAQHQAPELRDIARSRLATVLGRAVLAAVGAVATVDLVRDAVEIF